MGIIDFEQGAAGTSKGFSMNHRDFTLSVYRDLLAAIRSAGYNVLAVKDYFMHKEPPEPFIVLRHDVDRRPENALKMAGIEGAFGIRSTYYFRLTKQVFRPDIIRQIAASGHEIGYHYEVMDRAKGDPGRAERTFAAELGQLRSLADIRTACMHGNPLTHWDNRDFWKTHTPAQYGLLAEAYLSFDDPTLYYATDTGRGWNRRRYNLKDAFPEASVRLLPVCGATLQLVRGIASRKYRKVYLQIHPNRWHWRRGAWHLQLAEDLAANFIKYLILRLRIRRTGI